MVGPGRILRAAIAVGVGVVALSSCSWQRLDEAASTTTISGEMRPVPTVPTPEQAAAEAAAAAAAAQDPSAPTTTELVGDPQPNPDSEVTLPPLPDSPAVAACTVLADTRAVDSVTAAGGVAAVTEVIGEEACRFTAGGVVVEVHYVGESTIDDDWFVRDGIEPVGEVGPDAVGVWIYAPPGSSTSDGYSIGMIHRRQGVVVAVRGAADDRALAVSLATLVGTTI